MKTGTQIGAVVIGMLMAGVAAAAPPPGFEPAAQTPRFKFFTRGHDSVEAQKVEKFLVSLEQVLGHQFSGQAQYYRYERPEDIAAATGSYASGLTFASSREIHTTEPFHAHEVVHLLASQIGDPGPFFREGLAVALGDQGKWQGKSVDRLARDYARGLTLRALVLGFAAVDAQRAYPLAGSFVAHLIKRHGVQKVKELFATSPRLGGDETTKFASVFGQSLEEAETEWRRSL
jgi:hypothetical protein